MTDFSAVSKKQIARIRESLKSIREQFPGNSIELRVPYVGAIQCFSLPGANHHRGTPPNVAEISADIYERIISGDISFTDAADNGLLSASGRDIIQLADVFDALK